MAHRLSLLPPVIFAAAEPRFPIHCSGEEGGIQPVVSAQKFSPVDQGVCFHGIVDEKPFAIQLTYVMPGVIRVLLQPKVGVQTNRLVRPDAVTPVEYRIETSDNQVRLLSNLLSVHVDLEPFHITFYDLNHRLLLDQNQTDSDVQDRLSVLPFGFSKTSGGQIVFHDSFTAEADEHFYGFGEKFTNFDKRGQLQEMWVYDAYGAHSERAYKNVPFFISTRGYGVYVDSVTQVVFDMAESNHSAWMMAVPDKALDYYVIAGPDPKEIIQRYAGLVGRPILPPKWSLGLWMSSGFLPYSAEDAIRCARRLRELDIPCDVLHLDSHWQKFGNWSDLIWDKDLFPNPSETLSELKQMGYKICLWINSYISVQSPRFQEVMQRGYLLKTPTGAVYVGDLWGGYHPPVGVIDVTNPEAATWFKNQLCELVRMGADGFKSDFGEGVPPDAVAYNGMTGVELHNIYPLLYNDLVMEAIREVNGTNGPIWARSTFTGGQRHAAQWAGDSNCTYTGMASTLRGGLSLAMCGHPFWSHDIGGFHRHPTTDLYIRWAQFGLFSPMARAHGMTSRFPWDFSDEAVRIFRDYAKLRYRLAPYIYSYACVATDTSLPIMRPMALEYPHDPNTYTLDLQYLFGEEILVAPVYNPTGERNVYLPAGRWIDFWTNTVIDGPINLFVSAPLDILPLYVKANALIPTIEPSASLPDGAFQQVIFDAYLLDNGKFDLHDVDGITSLSAIRRQQGLELTVESTKPVLGLRLVPLAGLPEPEWVSVNGSRLDLEQVSGAARKSWFGEFAPGQTIWVQFGDSVR